MMKRKILPIVLALLVFFTNVFTPSTFAALQSMPVPRPPIEQERYDTDLFTGSAAYSYPIKVPKGTNDLTPDVSISYNSSGTKTGSQVVGLGWEVSRDFIERDIKFTIDNANDDSYKLHFKGKTYDLVYVASEDTYHTKIESNLRVKNIGSDGSNTYAMYWEVIEPNGTKYRFGYQDQSELACNGRYHAKQWNLDRVTDTHNNNIYYTYTESNGVSYLSTIKYNNDQLREIDFNYTSNPAGRQLYVQGCNVQETSKLATIQVKANSSIIRGYTLDYTSNANSMQLLSSITETGTSSGSALPATIFDYKPQIPSFQGTDVKWLNNQQFDYTDLDQDETTLMDVNGDSLPDIVRTYGDSTITWKVGLNTGSTWSSLSNWMTNNPFDAGLNDSYVRLMDVTGDGLPDIVRAASSGDWRVYRNTGSSWSTTGEPWGIASVHSSVNLTSSNVQLVDVTGDGLPDVVRSWWNGQRQWEVLKNTGSSWSNSAEIWSYGGISDDVGASDVTIADANGDGLADLIKTTHSGTNATWYVYKNTGSSWSTTPETWINNANIDAYLGQYQVTLADVNQDGLLDIVKIIDQGLNDKWNVLLNNGNGWSTVWQTWVIGVDADVEGEDNVVLSDVDGNTMPDIVKSNLNSGGNVTWQVWKNNGEAPDLLSSVKTSQGGVIAFDYKASGKFDNTGADSLSDLPFSLWVVDKMINNNGMPGTQATNDVTTYNYQDGMYDWQDREFRGFAVVDTVEPDTSKKKYVFNQSDALQGTLAEVQTRDSSNNPYGEIENTWDSYLINGVYTVNLAAEKEYTYDGTANNPKIKETDYQYDNYGNVIKKSELGDISISGDERYTYNEYVYNPAPWIVDKLSHTTLKRADDSTTVSEKWQYYDNDPQASASASAPSASKFGDGSDGDITISSNTTEAPIDAIVTAANSGGKIATVSTSTGFVTNQLVLFHQTQGGNAGTWEIARVASAHGTTLTLTANLTNTYTTSGSNKAQIRVLPQYHNVTINSGVTWSAKAWNGSTGGILAFFANGMVTNNGTINATGKGFRGAQHQTGRYDTWSGEGTTGASVNAHQVFAGSANGNGGGGAGTYNPNGTFGSPGGGGGNNASTMPAILGNGWYGQGNGGDIVGTADLTTMEFGGGGGSGGSNNYNGGNTVGGAGAAGGGIVFISAATMTANGAIVSNGNTGTSTNASPQDAGAGGGGGAGSILLKAQSATLGSGIIQAGGGAGGVGKGSSATNGMSGGNGRIRVQYETSLSGTTNPTASTNQSSIPTVPAGVLSWSKSTTSLTKGDLTKEIKWLSGGTNPETDYEYDSYGNLTKSIDPNNHETTYTYNINDSTRTYPERITNAKGQQTNFTYNLGTGNILTKTDANNLTVTYTYDDFGRITKEIQPYDSSTYPTKQYTYLNDGIAPEGTLMALREIGGAVGTLDVYMLVDGFGRKVQTRRDAENSANQIVQDTFYDPTGEVKKESVPYIASSSAAMVGVTPTPPPATKFGDGSDGDVAITSTITETPIDSSVTATASTTTASVSAGLAFKPNHIVLFHQTQGTNAGAWELARVASYSGTTLTMTTGLTNSYSSSASNRAQVRVVKQYDNVTVHSGGVWKAKEWNGSTGGILAFLAKGIVTVSGTITANGGQGGTSTAEFSPGGTGGGFRGGQGHRPPSSSHVNAWVGEGTQGPSFQLPNDVRINNGNGGGAVEFNTGLLARAGGGGGNGTSGGSTDPSVGGYTSGTADLSSMTFGGGGGGGGRGFENGTGTAGGGSGGGIIFVRGANVSVTGSITANGGNGGVDGNNNHANGGGGAGGSVLVNTQVASASAITAIGGQGYQGGGGTGIGSGGVGRIRISYENTASVSATPTASTAQVTIPLIAAGTVSGEPGPYGVYQAPDVDAKYTEYTYDTLGRVTMVKNPKGDLRTTAYDHWKETDIDENGHIKRRYLDAHEKIHKVEEVINFASHATNYLYNAMDQLIETIDSASNSGTMTYDTLGRKVSQTDPDMGTWTYVYDANGNLTSSTDAKNITVGRSYDQLNRLTAVNYPADTDLGFTYDIGKIGTLSIATDSAGTVSYIYDNRLRKTAETRVIDGTSKTTTFAYDSADRVTNQTNPDSTQSNYTFNNQGEIETLGGVLDDIDYNALGKITEKEFDNGLTTNYTYNTDDLRLARIQTGALQDLNYTYDAVGNITSIVDDVADKTKLFSYDDLDRLVTASESGSFNFAYEYNPIGNLTKFTSADMEIDYTYGENAGPHAMTGVVTMASSSASASSSANIAPNGTAYRWWYNSSSTADTNKVAAPILNDNNTGNEIGLRTFGTGYPEIDNAWEAAGVTWTATQSAITSVQFTNGAAADGDGPFTANFKLQFTTDGTTWTDSGWSFSPFYAYDNSSTAGTIYTFSGAATNIRGARVVGQVKTSGASSWYAVGREVKVFATTSTTAPLPSNMTIYGDALGSGWTDASYNTTVTATSSAYQGTTALRGTLNANGGLNLQSVSGASTSAYTAVRFALRASTSGQQYEVYADTTYGEPLTAPVSLANYGGQPTTSGWKVYTIPLADLGASNVLLKDIVIHDATESNQPALYVDSVQLVAAVQPPFTGAITYDANGNMLTKGEQCYEYNQANQLSKVKTCGSNQIVAEYVYDYKGQRMVKKNYDSGTLASTVISWSKGFETKAIVGGATETTNYYFANNELVAKKGNDGNKVYFHNDHLGSNSITTNQAGAQVEQVTYDPWGEVLGSATQSKYLYTGQEYDDESNLHYYDSRYYDSELRRFTQPDSIIQDVYNPQSLNRYSYAFNNPLKYVDPSGHINILNYNAALNAYSKKPNAITYNNILNVIGVFQKQAQSSTPAGGSNGGGNSNNSRGTSSSSSSGSDNNSKNEEKAVLAAKSSINNIVSASGDVLEAIRSSKASQINSGGLCFQGSAGIGAGGGIGGSASACGIYTKKDGLVFTGGIGVRYVPAGAEVSAGPAAFVSNAEFASELGGTDLNAGGSLKVGVGLDVEHSRSIDPNNLGNWSTTVGFKGGLGGDLHGGVSTTGALDIPWL